MGPTLHNLHKLVRFPTGCGEQNLAALGVNVHVLAYLDATQQTPPRRREKALSYIQQGEQWCRAKQFYSHILHSFIQQIIIHG